MTIFSIQILWSAGCSTEKSSQVISPPSQKLLFRSMPDTGNDSSEPTNEPGDDSSEPSSEPEEPASEVLEPGDEAAENQTTFNEKYYCLGSAGQIEDTASAVCIPIANMGVVTESEDIIQGLSCQTSTEPSGGEWLLPGIILLYLLLRLTGRVY